MPRTYLMRAKFVDQMMKIDKQDVYVIQCFFFLKQIISSYGYKQQAPLLPKKHINSIKCIEIRHKHTSI